MPLLAFVLVSTIDRAALRVALFIMVLAAVALILVGCIIALLTLYNQRKKGNADKSLAEWERRV